MISIYKSEYAWTTLGAAPNIAAEKSVSATAGQKAAQSNTISLRIEFTSNENFTDDLSDSSSQAFQDRVNLTQTQLTPVFQNAFASFLHLTGIHFSGDTDSGSGSGGGSGGGAGGGSRGGPGQKSEILISVHDFSSIGDPAKGLDPEEGIRSFEDDHLFSFRIDPTESLHRPLVTTADLVFNSSGVVPSTDQVVETLKQATLSIPIIPSSLSAINVPPATTAPPATEGPSSSGVSPVPTSVFSCYLLAWCSLLLATMFNLS
ncbi:hypothetical protein SKAU_G00393200 [Synaphobranchus kaupii]|uniref:SEA domain-containing protein n=1 Tax=Synaphobranchus kaupii TaxID=118154 RepID=A0A9Q1EC00_SYNKA|nr:hypothetical protein SKAU_G00393200 [Synaphobranchus kaupii]